MPDMPISDFPASPDLPDTGRIPMVRPGGGNETITVEQLLTETREVAGQVAGANANAAQALELAQTAITEVAEARESAGSLAGRIEEIAEEVRNEALDAVEGVVLEAQTLINDTAATALAALDVTPTYQSWTTSSPSSAGAVVGTRGTRKDADGNIELLEWDGSAWIVRMTIIASTSFVHPRLAEVKTAAFSTLSSAKASTTLLESFELNSSGDADRYFYKAGASESGDDVTVIARTDGRKYLSEKYIRRKSYGDGVNLLDAGVKLTNTPLQNSQAIDKLLDDIHGYNGGGKIIVPAVGRIDLDYAIMPKYDNLTFEGFGAGSHLYNASASKAFWMADVFVIGNFGEANFPRLWNDGEYKSLLTNAANTNKVTLSSAGDVTTLELAVGKIVLITSYEWIEPALVAAGYSAGAAATNAAANTGTMLENPDFTPLFSDLNEIMRIDGADIYLRYPIPFSLTTPKILNMNKQTEQVWSSFGYTGNARNLVALKNIHIRNMKISTNPANGNGMPIQASAMLGCTFENLELDGRGILYGNLQCHSIFKNINGRFYDTFADLKVGPYDMVYEDIVALLVPRSEFIQPYNVLWSPDVRASHTVFSRVKCYAPGHGGNLRLGGRRMTYRDCEFVSSATEMIVIPSGSTELPSGVGNPEDQIVHFRKFGHPASPLRYLNASGGKNIEITIDEANPVPSSNLAAFTSSAENIRVRMPIYPNASLAVSSGINCWVEEIMPRGLYRRVSNPGNITTTLSKAAILAQVNPTYQSPTTASPSTAGAVMTPTPTRGSRFTSTNQIELLEFNGSGWNVIGVSAGQFHTIRANTISKNGSLKSYVGGTASSITGGVVQLALNGTALGIVNLSASEVFEIEFALYARTETTNQRWSCKTMVNNAIAYTRGTLAPDVSANDFTLEMQGWRAAGTLTVDEMRIESFPAIYGS
jgi:hypothetical protein